MRHGGRFARLGAVLKLSLLLVGGWLVPAAGGAQPVTIVRDPMNLPASVQTMREAILEAARKGDLSELRYAMELNEMPPMIGPLDAGEPLAYLAKVSADGKGAEAMARLSLLLEAPSALVKDKDGAVMYVWPYLAVAGLKDASTADRVELFRLAPPAEAKAMLEKGEYSGWRLGISGAGIWHYLDLDGAKGGG